MVALADTCWLSVREPPARSRIMKLSSTVAMLSLAMAATQAMAQPAPRMLVSDVEPATQPDSMRVEITLLNPGPDPKVNSLPDRIPAELTISGCK
jgi:phospholipase A1